MSVPCSTFTRGAVLAEFCYFTHPGNSITQRLLTEITLPMLPYPVKMHNDYVVFVGFIMFALVNVAETMLQQDLPVFAILMPHVPASALWQNTASAESAVSKKGPMSRPSEASSTPRSSNTEVSTSVVTPRRTGAGRVSTPTRLQSSLRSRASRKVS